MASVRDFFDAIAGRYDRVYALERDASRSRLASIVSRLPPSARVLDLGVGTGRELSALQDAGHSPVGVDLSAAMLARCARRARPVPLVQADFWAPPLPFAAGSFDAVLALHGALSHPPSPEATLPFGREVHRLLRAGGVAVFEVPTPAWLEAMDAAPPAGGGDLYVRRLGPARCLHGDRVAGTEVEAWVLPAETWGAALGPSFRVEVEPLGPFEVRLFARKRDGEGAPAGVG